MSATGWIIGTIILWVLKAIGTLPLARALSGVSGSPAPTQPLAEGVAEPAQGEAAQPTQGEAPQPAQGEAAIPTGIYIFADVIVMGAAGFLIGLVTGYYFIGFSWRARDWPGMLAFIVASVIGSIL